MTSSMYKADATPESERGETKCCAGAATVEVPKTENGSGLGLPGSIPQAALGAAFSLRTQF